MNEKKNKLDEKIKSIKHEFQQKNLKDNMKENSKMKIPKHEGQSGNLFGISKLKEKETGESSHFNVKEGGDDLITKLLGSGIKNLFKKKKEGDKIEFTREDEKKFGVFGKEMIVKKQTLMILIINTFLVGGIVTINYLMLKDTPTLFSTINIIALFIFSFPLILLRYNEYKKLREIEEIFPIFLRDFVESIRGGMTLPQVMKTLKKNNYGSLTPYISKMAAQLDWGIPVERVLLGFARSTKSKLIMRIISSVVESHRFGGNLSDTFEALTETAVEIDKLREERRLYMNSQMITGYIIFFVFLAVMIGLQKFLVPSLENTNTGGLLGSNVNANTEEPNKNISQEYETIFRNLILIQGFFAGLSVGKMSEGSMVSGLKHSMFMMFVGFIAFTVAS